MFKKILLASAVAGILASSGALAQGTPSAKFVAVWSDTPALVSLAAISNATANAVAVDKKSGYTLATIKVPQAKELLVGVSAEIGLVTGGEIKGSGGGGGTAIADAEAYVTVYAVPRDGGAPVMAKPGLIMLNKRVQKLSATLGGVLQSCADTNGDGVIDAALECVVTLESIGLLLDTTSAHHFNFVLPDMNQGVYDIKAYFTTGARAEVIVCSAPCGGTAAVGIVSATAKAVINKSMMTVQTVRAAKNTLNGMTIIEIQDAN